MKFVKYTHAQCVYKYIKIYPFKTSIYIVIGKRLNLLKREFYNYNNSISMS